MDKWEHGAGYENYMGRWSVLAARQFVPWLGIPQDSAWLDVGCGTGALSGEIARTALPRRISAIDHSAEFVEAARARLGGGIDVRRGDAQSLPFDAGEFDATASGLALNFFPDPGAAIREILRVTRSGGVVAVYVWDYSDGMQMIRAFWDVAVDLDPTIADLDEAARFPICRRDRLEALFAEAGLKSVATTPLGVPTVFPTFDDYWSPMLAGQGPAPSYVSSLDAAKRVQLRGELRRRLPVSTDGSINLVARAWATRGTV